MDTYVFRAYNSDNIRIGGSRKAISEDEVKKHINENGLINPTICVSKTGYSAKNYNLVSPRELSIFCRQMSVLFFSQVTLMEGVRLLAEQTGSRQLKIALDEIYSYMKDGTTFAEAVCMYPHIFGAYLINMISIGENSGTLDDVFTKMSSYFDREDKVRRKLRSAVAYPAVLTVLMSAIVVFLILKILPMFSNLLDSMGGEAPGFTNVILAVSLFITRYLWIILAVIVFIVAALILVSKSAAGKRYFDKMKVKFPGVKYIFTRLITARFARSMAILLKSGIQLLNALDEIYLIIDNKYLETKFKTVVKDVKAGTSLASALEKIGIFPKLFLKMIVIGESTGRLDEMLDRSASIFDDDVNESMEKITLMIEPILIIILSVIVGVILVSVMLPMINIMNTIG